jgi:uncharacterized protein (DUF433 family)
MSLKNLTESRIIIDGSNGKPQIKGTKVSVAELILQIIEGKEPPDIVRAYRSLRLEDIKACLAYCYCISDNIALKLQTTDGATKDILKDPELERDNKEKAFNIFYETLENQASVQEDLTKAHIKRLKETKKLQVNEETSKMSTPNKRAYDLIIELGVKETTRIFTDQDAIEQKLDMSFDNYLFQIRKDGKAWLTYSVKDKVEIDKQMRRNLKVRFINLQNAKDEGIYEGYLSTDRKHKIFIERNEEGKTCGRAL